MSLAAVTIALRNLLQAAMPPKVEVTTLPLLQAEKFVKLGAQIARVNLLCHQVSPLANVRNISLTRIDSPAIHGPKVPPLNALYLVTVYGTNVPEQVQSTERLLEAVFQAMDQKPMLSAAELGAALPAAPEEISAATARIAAQTLTFAETEGIFTILKSTYHPTLAYQVTVTAD
jgi:hypothetical protein